MIIIILPFEVMGQESLLDAAYKKGSDRLFHAYLLGSTSLSNNNGANDTIIETGYLLSAFFQNYYRGLDTADNQLHSEKLLIFVNPAFKLAFVGSLDTQTVLINELRRTFPAPRYDLDSLERKYRICSSHPRQFIVENFFNVANIKKDTEMIMGSAVHLPAEQSYYVIWDGIKMINDLNRFIAVPAEKEKSQRIKFLQQHINIHETYVKGIWDFGPVFNIRSIVFDNGMKTAIIIFHRGNNIFNALLKRQGQEWQVEKMVEAGWIN